MTTRTLQAFSILAAASIAPAAAAEAPQASYQTAFALTRAGSFDQAEAAWRDFLRQHPDDPLAGNAQYFLGESYYGRGEYRRAAALYAEGAEKYPKSELAPETLLKLGISLGRAGQAEAACDAFQRLDRGFPNAAGVVRERGMVERRQYRCPAAPPEAAPLKVAEPPAPAMEPPPAVAAADPAPPAVPVPPVAREKLPADEAERNAARAELVAPPPAPAPPHAVHRTAAIPVAAPAPSPESVKTAQTLLAALEYDSGPPDGQVGPKLRAAVRTFQARAGLKPDGDVSDALLQRLSAALVAKKVTPVAATVPAAKPEAKSERLVGTGFIASRSGYVIASHRLVASCREIRVQPIGGESVAAPLVAHDARNDLALLRLKAPAEAAVTFRDGRGPRQGDGVVVTGFGPGDAESSDFHLTTGVVSALSGARNDNSLLEVSAALGAGHGGGPVFDAAGHVVAIAADGADGRGAALKAAMARNFLDAHDVEYDSAASTAELKPADIGDLAKKAVVLVECRR